MRLAPAPTSALSGDARSPRSPRTARHNASRNRPRSSGARRSLWRSAAGPRGPVVARERNLTLCRLRERNNRPNGIQFGRILRKFYSGAFVEVQEHGGLIQRIQTRIAQIRVDRNSIGVEILARTRNGGTHVLFGNHAALLRTVVAQPRPTPKPEITTVHCFNGSMSFR